MTPEQTEMFKLQSTSIPGQPIHQMTIDQPEPVVDEVNQGLALTMAHMIQNGPTRPIQRGQAKTMTKDQYKEQMMNEERGLPSNLDEASRVVALEQKIENVNQKLAQILAAINPPRMSEMFDPKTGMLMDPQEAIQPVAPPPTPQENLVAVPQPPPIQPGQVRYHPPLQTDAPPTEPPTPEVPVSPPVTSQQPSPQPASQETAPPTSSVSLGPVGSQGPDPTSDDVSLGEDRAVVERPLSPDQDQFLDDVIEKAESSPSETVSDIASLIEENGEPTVDLVEQKRLERQQVLTDQVSSWLVSKNPHSFWKKFLSSACNKNLSYNTWPPEFQASFDKRFQDMLGDPSFISTLCGRIIKMQNGHMVAPNVAGAFIVVIAGMLSFALLEG